MGPKGTGGFWPLGFSPGGWAACPWCPDHPGTVAWAQHGGDLGAGVQGRARNPCWDGKKGRSWGDLDWGCMGV